MAVLARLGLTFPVPCPAVPACRTRSDATATPPRWQDISATFLKRSRNAQLTTPHLTQARKQCFNHSYRPHIGGRRERKPHGETLHPRRQPTTKQLKLDHTHPRHTQTPNTDKRSNRGPNHNTFRPKRPAPHTPPNQHHPSSEPDPNPPEPQASTLSTPQASPQASPGACPRSAPLPAHTGHGGQLGRNHRKVGARHVTREGRPPYEGGPALFAACEAACWPVSA